jgi:hypothetical protein
VLALASATFILWLLVPMSERGPGRTTPPAAWYQASITLSHDRTAQESPAYLESILQRGPIPAGVAQTLRTSTVEEAADRLEVVATDSGESLLLRFTHSDPESARAGVELYAHELVIYLAQQRVARRDAEAEQLSGRLDDERRRVADAAARATAEPEDALLQAQLDSSRVSYQRTYSRLRSTLAADVTSPTVVDSDVDLVARSAGGVVTRVAHTTAVLLGMLGALAVAVLSAVTLGALDRRIHSATELESASGIPVLVELPRRRGGGNVSTASDPGMQTLRAILSAGPRANGPRVVVVTALSGDEDAAWVAADLSDSAATAGMRVATIGGRREPGHRLHGKGGQIDAPRTYEAFVGAVWDLPVQLANATQNCDLLVVIAPPLDRVQATTAAVRFADDVVVVVRAGRVTGQQAATARDQLHRLGAGRVGAVLLVPARISMGGALSDRLSRSGGRP